MDASNVFILKTAIPLQEVAHARWKAHCKAKRRALNEEINAYIRQVADAHFLCQAWKTHEAW
ncbi:hypothetical protein SNOG_07362 [Parastagonospora nodorum SN15]|uniref:Uncharacterized protein n=1 Tax=Phaeosphaeria nodorum (strain SN15 / ATCC MYA-4574 / FGSC 10173) TaxID=321614 RepID=Q0ULK2_PHANO|nr:hypothetical protein SNOG_07362 [Parastagonospora nodorum SN15]EAT84828.1 hypothetical protein SNOG_07362 [Parastagonospora nodorum SN15]